MLSRYLHSLISAFSSICLCPTPFNVESEVRLNSCGKKNTNFCVSKHTQIISQYQNILAFGRKNRSFAINSNSVYQHQYSKKDFDCDYNRQLIRQRPTRSNAKIPNGDTFLLICASNGKIYSMTRWRHADFNVKHIWQKLEISEYYDEWACWQKLQWRGLEATGFH